MILKGLQNKKIGILWFWKEGQSTLKFLTEQGIRDITILDKKDINLHNNILEEATIKKIIWKKYLDTLEIFDIIFKTPWISPFHDKIKVYREKLSSQTELFFTNYRGKVIGITGTKGKSTVSTLLYQCLKKAWYNVKLVWNIGSPVLDEIDISGDKKVYDFVIYEMSSYMLQDFSPELYIGFLNNIYPCHLDWHYNSWNIYKEAKLNILRNSEIQIVNGDFSMDNDIAWIFWKKIYFNLKGKYTYTGRSFFIGTEEIYTGKTSLLWEHNKQNISWTIAILDNIILNKEKLKQVLKDILPSFSGLPNRIEDIGTYEGIRFINDAIATTPESTIAAIETFWWQLQTIFLWWEDSWFDFSQIRQKILESQVQNIIAFPDTTEKIFPEIKLRDYEVPFELEIEWRAFQIIKTRSMRRGVDFAYKTTFPSKIALLSCAAPSFSLWNSYLDKADEFRKEVENY